MYAQCTGNGETEREIDVDLLKADTMPREFDFFDVMVDVLYICSSSASKYVSGNPLIRRTPKVSHQDMPSCHALHSLTTRGIAVYAISCL
jgi:hypothetical protein